MEEFMERVMSAHHVNDNFDINGNLDSRKSA